MRRIPYFILALLVILLFIDIPGSSSNRAVKNLLDSGHLVLFSLFWILLLKKNYWPRNLSLFRQIVIIFLITIGLSIIIEGIQFFTNRSAELSDIGRNLIGTALAVIYSGMIKDQRLFYKFFLKISILVIIFLSLIPLIRSTVDEINARVNFPVLATFESSFEMDRWVGTSLFKRSNIVARDGEYSLQIQFIDTTYSGMELVYFPGNWSNYKYLNFSIYYGQTDTFIIYVRIHDINHMNYNQDYSDRYNTSFVLHHGWNDLQICLKDVAKAPKTRLMDLTKIDGLIIFAYRPQKYQYIYLDHLYLSTKRVSP